MQTPYIFNLERAIELGILTLAPPSAPDSPGDGGGDDGAPDTGCFVVDDDVLPSVEDKRYLRLIDLLPRGDVSQRDVLRYIQQGQGTTVAFMAAHFGVTTSHIVGTINGGLQRNIKKAGFPSIPPILRIVKEAGCWHYYPGPVLLRHPPVPK